MKPEGVAFAACERLLNVAPHYCHMLWWLLIMAAKIAIPAKPLQVAALVLRQKVYSQNKITDLLLYSKNSFYF
jgi:hypothetical protein